MRLVYVVDLRCWQLCDFIHIDEFRHWISLAVPASQLEQIIGSSEYALSAWRQFLIALLVGILSLADGFSYGLI